MEKIVEQQKQRIEDLNPSKEKQKKFERLCKEYHIAAVNRAKAAMHCRETQTVECRLKENKENAGNSANVDRGT